MQTVARNYKGRQDRPSLTTETGIPVVQLVTDPQGRLFGLKNVDQTKHQLRTPPSWAMDRTVLAQAKAKGVRYFRLVDKSSGRMWSVNVSEFDRHGFPFARGHSPQVALPLGFWTEGPSPQEGLFGGDF